MSRDPTPKMFTGNSTKIECDKHYNLKVAENTEFLDAYLFQTEKTT